LILSACVTTVPPSAEESLEKALLETTTLPQAFTGRISPEVPALPANWIDAVRDPRLKGIGNEALRNNLNLRAAVSQVEAAARLVTQAGSRMKPVIAVACR